MLLIISMQALFLLVLTWEIFLLLSYLLELKYFLWASYN